MDAMMTAGRLVKWAGAFENTLAGRHVGALTRQGAKRIAEALQIALDEGEEFPARWRASGDARRLIDQFRLSIGRAHVHDADRAANLDEGSQLVSALAAVLSDLAEELHAKRAEVTATMRAEGCRFDEEEHLIASCRRSPEMAARVVSRLLAGADRLDGRLIAFTGSCPYLPSDLARLLPPDSEVDLGEGEQSLDLVDLVVVGQAGYDEERMRDWLDASDPGSIRFLPQEGFLDELLFGYDWWKHPELGLDDALEYHQGLQFAKSLADERLQPDFRWPGTDDPDDASSRSGSSLQEATELHRLGYRITGLTRRERWDVLCREAVPRLGLCRVAWTIAGHVRLRQQQADGGARYAHAIGEWEHDLERLKATYYDPPGGPRHHGFEWP